MASFFLRLPDAGSPRDAHVALQGELAVTPPRVSTLLDTNPLVEQVHFFCRDDRALPLYGAMKDAPHGLYLGLLHGRNQLDTPLDGLGYPGPAIGPLCHVRTAYAAHLYLRFADPATSKLFFPAPSAEVAEDALIGLQLVDELGPANAAIALTGDEFRRQQPV